MGEAPTILVADDDEEWRRLLSFCLERNGYRVCLSCDGGSVLPLAREHRPDCFILDFELGDTTGGEVCRDIKSRPEWLGKPVVILTGQAGAMPHVIAGYPPDQFVVKSGSTDELLLVLETLLPKPAH